MKENQIKAGLWLTKSKNGNEYYGGKILINDKNYRVALFTNKNKLSDKSPDYNLSLSEINNIPENGNTDPLQQTQNSVSSISQDEITLAEEDYPF